MGAGLPNSSQLMAPNVRFRWMEMMWKSEKMEGFSRSIRMTLQEQRLCCNTLHRTYLSGCLYLVE